MQFIGGGGGKLDDGQMGAVLGPGHVDHAIRNAIQFCWMALPKERRTVDEVDKEIRRIVERALASLREDAEAFKLPAP